MTVVTRECINRNILIHQHNHTQGSVLDKTFDYHEFCMMIDYWKLLLIDKYQVQRGNTMFIDFELINTYYYSLIFAAAELGIVMIIDWPHCWKEEDLLDHKVTMYGTVDFVVTQKEKFNRPDRHWDVQRNLKYAKNIILQDEFDEYLVKDNTLFPGIAQLVWAQEDDAFCYTCSSGTTGLAKRIENDHKKIYDMAANMVRHLEFDPNARVLHTRNMHHGASLCYHFLPGFIAGGEQFTYTLNDHTDEEVAKIVAFTQLHQLNQLFLYIPEFLLSFLKQIDSVQHPVRISTLFQITLEVAHLVKEKNIQRAFSPFGDSNIAAGIFVKKVDKNTDLTNYEVGDMGPPITELFDCEVRADSMLYVRCQKWNQDWRSSGDLFEVRNGNFVFMGRANNYRINMQWIQQATVEKLVRDLFGFNKAHIVIDPEMQKVYAAIWEHNPEAEQALHQYFEDNFEELKIAYVIKNEKFEHFWNSRKIDYSKIRDYCRSKLGIKL